MMEWNFWFFFNSILMGVGLAMDAFSVSMANGLNEPHMRAKKGLAIAGTFAGFQFAMPMIGWFCVHTIVQYFQMFERFIPWIALLLLLWIGGKMVYEGIRGDDDLIESGRKLGKWMLLGQGIATSIDALSVGFTIENYGLIMALAESVIIAIVTFYICLGGLKLGKIFGIKLAGKATVLGGVILIAIGIEIFVKGI